MLVVIHQPHFFPWLGYFNKLFNADCLVFQDDVQFRKRYFQNRTKIRNIQGKEHWLTVPVHANRTTLIKDVYIADDKWKNKTIKTLYHSYHRYPFFYETWNEIESTIWRCRNRLIDINYLTIDLILRLLKIEIEIVISSHFKINDTPPENLVKICQKIGANGYIFGEGGGLSYHGKGIFKNRGIKPYQQNFLSKYNIISEKYFSDCNNLSVLDFLFKIGIKNTRNIITSSWDLKTNGDDNEESQ